MSNSGRDWPDFMREALEEEDAAEADRLDAGAVEALRLPELLPGSGAASGLDRLLAAVSEKPLRYAPFFTRLSTLWDVPESEVEAVLERSRDPLAWRKALPGVKLIDVKGGPKTQGGETRLVRFAPGLTFPKHRHPGPESILVLEGSYTDSLGRVVGPGDLHEMLPGSEHSFVIARDEPCIAASCQVGLEFTGPVMRLLSKILGSK